jgi:hypothetical protein
VIEPHPDPRPDIATLLADASRQLIADMPAPV